MEGVIVNEEHNIRFWDNYNLTRCGRNRRGDHGQWFVFYFYMRIRRWIWNGFDGVREMNELEKLYGKPYIDNELIDRVDYINENGLLHDDSWKTWEKHLGNEEARELSDWCRTLEKSSKSELAVATIVAMENYPEMVMQVAMEYIERLKEGVKKNDRNSD